MGRNLSKHLLLYCAAFVLLFAPLACSKTEIKKKELTIFVPCSIFAAFCEILDAYKQEHPDIKVSFDTGNSVVLMRKVLNKGARPDVYIGTGPLEIEPLIAKGLIIPETVTDLTFDSLILVSPASNPKAIKAVDDLAKTEVEAIAIPDPKINSSGKFAVEYFTERGIWDKIKHKVTFTEFGRNTRNFITENKIDAGIMYRSCLYEDLKAYDEVIAPKDIFVVEDLYAVSPSPIASKAGILSAAKNKEVAQGFVNYMASEKAKAILKKWEGKKIENK